MRRCAGYVAVFYMDFDSFRAGTFTLAPGSLIRANLDTRFRDHVLRVGLNCAFGGPVIASIDLGAVFLPQNQKPGIAGGFFVVQAREGLRRCCGIFGRKRVCADARTTAIWTRF